MKKFGEATISPKEMRERKERNYFKEHFVGEWDYEKDRYRKRKEYEYERRVRETEEQLRMQMKMNQPRSAQEMALMQDQAREQLRFAEQEARARMQQDMAMAYPGNENYITSGGSNYVVASSSDTGPAPKKKSEKFNWNRPFRAALQDETDEWLKDVLKAA